MAISPSGSIWISMTNMSPGILELDTTGAVIFPSGIGSLYSGPLTGLSGPTSVAIDHSGNVWVANGLTIGSIPSYGVAEFSSTGALVSPAAIFSNQGGYDREPWQPSGICIDGTGNVFIASKPNFLVELNNNGSMISPSGTPYTDNSLNAPTGIAVDGSGNVWLSNYAGNSITEFVGAAAPVVTPIAAGVANNTLGTRP
jgi:streptogramin lyase